MQEILLAGMLVVLHSILYIFFGTVFLKTIKSTRYDLINSFLLGFFVYYGIFQLIATPCTLLKNKLSIVVILWAVIVVCLSVFCLIKYYKDIGNAVLNIFIKDSSNLCRIITILAVVFLIVVVCLNTQVTYDSAYYIGNVNTMINTNHMYMHDPYTGFETGWINYRYALSSFSTHSAVVCSWFNISPLVEMRITVGSLTVIISNLIIYSIGKAIFLDKKKAYLLTSINITISMFFNTIYAPSSFLVNRGYEGKAYCSNVVIPMTAYICYLICKDVKNDENWRWLFAITLAADTISMSSMLIIPAMVLISTGVAVFANKEYRYIKNIAICMIPCVAIVAIFVSQFMFMEGGGALW